MTKKTEIVVVISCILLALFAGYGAKYCEDKNARELENAQNATIEAKKEDSINVFINNRVKEKSKQIIDSLKERDNPIKAKAAQITIDNNTNKQNAKDESKKVFNVADSIFQHYIDSISANGYFKN